MNLLAIFTILNIINVILQTIKSIATFKCGKTMAAIINAVAYGLYTIVLVYTVCDLPLLLKAAIVAACNFVGVWIVKYGEEKARKDKLWKVEATFAHDEPRLLNELKIFSGINDIAYNYIDIEKYYVVNFYCPTQKDSAAVKYFVEHFHGKYFVSESKTLE